MVGTIAGCSFGGGGAGVVGVPTVVAAEDVARTGDAVAADDGLERAGEEMLGRSALDTAVDNAGFFSGRTPSMIKQRSMTNSHLNVEIGNHLLSFSFGVAGALGL